MYAQLAKGMGCELELSSDARTEGVARVTGTRFETVMRVEGGNAARRRAFLRASVVFFGFRKSLADNALPSRCPLSHCDHENSLRDTTVDASGIRWRSIARGPA